MKKVKYLFPILISLIGALLFLNSEYLINKLFDLNIKKGICVIKTDQYLSFFEDEYGFGIYILDSGKVLKKENDILFFKALTNNKSINIKCNYERISHNIYYTTYYVYASINASEVNGSMNINELLLQDSTGIRSYNIGNILLEKVSGGIYCDNTDVDLGVLTYNENQDFYFYVKNKSDNIFDISIKPYNISYRLYSYQEEEIYTPININSDSKYILIRPYFEFKNKKQVANIILPKVPTSYSINMSTSDKIVYINKMLDN